MTNKALIAEWLADEGEESDFFRVRVRGEFPMSGALQLIPYDRVRAACERESFHLPSDPIVFGLDVARYGDDEAVLAIRKGRDAKAIPWLIVRGLDIMQLAARVAVQADHYKPAAIFVDEGGMGVGVIDRLRQLGHRCVAVNFGGNPVGLKLADERFKAARRDAEMWISMREWLAFGAIPNDPVLEEQLTGRDFDYNNDNAIVLEKKDKMKARGIGSPDRADALALTFAAPIVPAGTVRRARSYDTSYATFE